VFLASVAVASVAVLGILNLTDGPSSGSSDATAVPASGKTSTPARAATTDANASSNAATAKAKAKAKAKPKPKPAEAPEATPKPKSSVAPGSTPKRNTGATRKTTKPAAAAKPQAKAATGTAKAKPAQTQPKPKTPAAAPEPRRFAWAPVEGATGYHVELFRGNDRVLAEETKQPVLELGPSWRYEGRVVRLTAGDYRWYVWPVTKSGRATQAVVQAKLSIP
jgi:hypothetical protein